MDQSETNSHEVLRDEILADAQRQAKRMIRKAEREAKAADRQGDRREPGRTQTANWQRPRQTAERKRTLMFATVPVEIGRMRAARVEQELLALREQVRDKLSAREGFDYGETLVTLAAEAIARMEGDAFVLELSEEDRKAFGATLAGRRAGRVPDARISP